MQLSIAKLATILVENYKLSVLYCLRALEGWQEEQVPWSSMTDIHSFHHPRLQIEVESGTDMYSLYRDLSGLQNQLLELIILVILI